MSQFIRVKSDTILNVDQISKVHRFTYGDKVYIAVRMIGDPVSIPLASAFSYDDPEVAENEFLFIVSSLKASL